jgi:hypothetical protein
MMPRRDGFETALVSASAEDDELVTRSRALGIQDYLAKPLDAALLLGKIARYEP